MFRLKLAGGVESRFFAEADIQKPLRNEGLEDPDGKCFRAGELHLAGCGSLQALGVVLVYRKPIRQPQPRHALTPRERPGHAALLTVSCSTSLHVGLWHLC